VRLHALSKTLTLRRYLVAGLLVWVPAGITILIIKFLVDLMDQTLLLLPPAWRPEQLVGFRIPGLGLVLTIVIVLATGIVVTNFLGQRLLHLGERIVARVPLVRSVYGAAKQVMHTLFSKGGKSFRKVVLVEYPRHGIWSLGFLTGDGTPEISRHSGRPMVNVFIPTTPNPTSGFLLVVPREDARELNMTVDDGLKMIISLGVIVPEERKQALLGEQKARG